jgi:hypothetical protein
LGRFPAAESRVDKRQLGRRKQGGVLREEFLEARPKIRLRGQPLAFIRPQILKVRLAPTRRGYFWAAEA